MLKYLNILWLLLILVDRLIDSKLQTLSFMFIYFSLSLSVVISFFLSLLILVYMINFLLLSSSLFTLHFQFSSFVCSFTQLLIHSICITHDLITYGYHTNNHHHNRSLFLLFFIYHNYCRQIYFFCFVLFLSFICVLDDINSLAYTHSSVALFVQYTGKPQLIIQLKKS